MAPANQQKKPKQANGPGSPSNKSLDLTKVRAYAACRSCRQKKVRCLPSTQGPTGSGDQPGPCQQCVQGGLECTYPPTRDRAAYSRQYVQNLEGRVQALEMMQNRMTPLLEAYERQHLDPSSLGGGKTALSLELNGTSSGFATRPKVEPPFEWRNNGNASFKTDADRGREGGDLSMMTGHDSAEDDDDDEDGAGGPTLPPSPDAGQITQDDRGNYRWIGASNTLSLLDSFAHRQSPKVPTPPIATATAANPYFGPVAGAGVVKALPGVDEVVFPDAERGMKMVDAFFRDVYPVLPVVIESEYRQAYNTLMEKRSSGEPVTPGGFISVVFAIYALGERVLVTSNAWNRERDKLNAEGKEKALDDGETVLPGEAEAGVIWYERAQILHYTTLKDVNVYQVQCLTLMAAFQASVNAMPMSWLLAGQALRVAQDLGLHRSTAGRGYSFVDKQLRSRCWWAIYGLERLVSVSLGRPLGVDDLDIDVQLPAPVADDSLQRLSRDSEAPEEPEPCTMSGFVALTKLCKIAGRVAHLLYRPSDGKSVSDATWSASQQNTVNKLDRMLKEWLERDVPSKYKDPSTTTSRTVQLVSAILSNAYFTVLLTLHRNFLPSNPDYPRPRPPSNSQSLSHLVEAARSVIHVATQQRVLLPPSHHLSAYCHNLWSSAVILLLCEVRARDQIVIDAVGSSVESCRRILHALEPAWPGSRKLKELLNDAEVRAKEKAVASPTVPKRVRKRKSSSSGSSAQSNRKRGMPPPPNRQIPSVSNADPRRAYETSNTRTFVRDDDPYLQHQQLSTPFSAPPSHLPINHSPPGGVSFDHMSLFDVGGVTFDGLGMLQGLSSNPETNDFWNSFISPTGQANYVLPSGQNTPNSSGPSPGNANGWNIGRTPAGTNSTNAGTGNNVQGCLSSNNGINATPAGINAQLSPVNGPGAVIPNVISGAGSDFWSQLAPGGGFDWGADPSVPFNI